MVLYEQWVAARKEAGWPSDRSFCEAAGVSKNTVHYLFKEEDNGAGFDTMSKMYKTFNAGLVAKRKPAYSEAEFLKLFPKWAKEAILSATSAQ